MGFQVKVCGDLGVDGQNTQKRSWQFISGAAVLQRPKQQSLWGSTNLSWAYYESSQ